MEQPRHRPIPVKMGPRMAVFSAKRLRALDSTRHFREDGHQEGVAVGWTRLGTKSYLHHLIAVQGARMAELITDTGSKEERPVPLNQLML